MSRDLLYNTVPIVNDPMHATLLQSCPALCYPMDCSLPGFSVHGILQARILEWVAIPFSRGSSPTRDQILVPWIVRWILSPLDHQGSPHPLSLHCQPGGTSGKGPACQLRCKRPGFGAWVGKIPWKRAWQPTPVFFTIQAPREAPMPIFLLGESHGQRNLAGYTP